MKNCLVTTLKAAVNNDNLKKLGIVNVTYVADGATGVQIGIDNGGEIICKNGTFSIPSRGLSGLTSYKQTDVNPYMTIVPSEGNVEFELSAYKIFRFTGYNEDGTKNTKVIVEDASELNFIGTLVESTVTRGFGVPKASFGGVMSFKDSSFWSNLKEIGIGHDGEREFRLNFNDLESTIITAFTCTNNLVELNIEDSNMPNLTSWNLVRNPNIYGDLKVWANKMWNNGTGRTSGSCKINTIDNSWNKTQLTWDGTPIYRAISGVYAPYIKFSQNAEPILSATSD